MIEILKSLIRKKEKNKLYEFECFKNNKLKIPSTLFKTKINYFKKLKTITDHKKDYRNAFFFQFSTTFGNIIEIEAEYKGSARSIDIMEIIKPYIKDKGECLSVGSHNGGELFWLYDNTALNINGVESNPTFFSFCNMLINSYNLNNRINVKCESASYFINKKKKKFDLIILHGLIYMLKNPLNFLKKVYESLNEDGICSIETLILKDKKPIMKYIGNGSGWGDTFYFSESFLRYFLKDVGFKIIDVLDYDGRRIFILKKKIKDLNANSGDKK